MEIKKYNKRDLIQAAIGIAGFIILLILIKYMRNNHTHDGCSHKQSSVELVDTISLVDSINTIYDTIKPVKTQSLPVTSKADSTTVGELIEAMILVESRGDDSAYCKREEAVGCLQIRPIMLREVNRLLSRRGDDRRYTLEDRWSREKSIEIFMVFSKSKNSLEQMARNWNGGPRGYKRSATLGYWSKVVNNITKV
jgi:hypothetical protein|tara:strand:+ start:3314 stop:3901 length:588 start_codon:yes stop_codon:yes gene_type:complete